MSKSVLFSRVSYSASAKTNNAASYYRLFLAARRMAKHHANLARHAEYMIDQLKHESIAADYEYEATLQGLRLANNREDSRHVTFADLNIARAKRDRALRDYWNACQVIAG